MPMATRSGHSSPPSLKVATIGSQRRRSSRRKSSKSWRSVPPTFRQSTTCSTRSAMCDLPRAGCRNLRAVEELACPQLQGHQAPQGERVIAAAVEVLGDERLYGVVVQPTALGEALVAEDRLHRLA